MPKTLAIVGARLNSSRLPNKHLLELAGKPMIEQIWRRLNQCSELDLIELATTADKFNQPLINWATSQNVNCTPFEGNVNDLMARLDFIIKKHQPTHIVYICGDCPLVDPDFIDHAVKALKHAQYKDSIKLDSAIESIHEGMAFYTLAGWNKLMRASQCEMSREHVGYADSLSPVLNKLIIKDSEDFSIIKHRISVDTQADYRFMSEVYHRWFEEEHNEDIVSLLWVTQQLFKDEKLASINDHVNQKAPERQYPIVSLYCQVSSLVGLGHLKRCSLIAESLQERLSVSTEIIILGEASQLPWLKTKAVWLNEPAQFLTHIEKDLNKLFLIDLHPEHFPLEELKRVCQQKQSQGTPIVALDKMSALMPYSDLLFIPSFYSEITGPKVHFGWENYLLPSISETEKENIVLILTGGSDALNYGAELPDLLLPALLPDWRYIWVQGPMSAPPNLAEDARIECLKNPMNLPELIAKAKIVITCYGLSLFESLAQGAAVILLPTKHLCSENELKELDHQRVCEIVETIDDIGTLLLQVQNNPQHYSKLIEKSRSLFTDKSGLTILAEHVGTLLNKNSKR
ncbi:cytidylyltransferase domain-containing protein [Shewanella intestini]|uniref:NTP transferase domain-containing protein n=1 Tax=Shewanella intestini TaxID=2017544 RepID=A0ABS5HY66_9GAMM|nr:MULTISPECIES: NTP transferase domain-containing protein [Shewanella]MBR9726728.1 NTP transferase domain-containing protein [Shewanella intestini]MRG34706.1 NTP transferase domain-containing protein [Shewanella sp. XMDDZSB0408]